MRVDTPDLQVETEAARGLAETQVDSGGDVAEMATDGGGLPRRIVDAKMRLHCKLLDEMNLSAVEKASHAELKATLSELVSGFVLEERLPVNSSELESLVEELIDEMTGLGPIEPLLKDPTINDILINTHECVYVERFGLLERVPLVFKDEAHLTRIVNKVVSAVGRRVDEAHPLCDARLADGSRVNVAVRPVAVDGPLVSIRKFSRRRFSLDRLVEVGALRPAVANLLAHVVKCRLSILVSGGTGSGKTTMLNALSENALRMRPDRIIVGEVRGEEAFDMLQAMNTGHEGSMTTIHANATRDALSRLEQMVGMAGFPMSQISIRSQVASAISLVIQLQRLSDGKRRVTQVSEITGMEGDVVQTQDIYEFVRSGVDSDGQVLGELRATGIRPKFLEQLNLAGCEVPSDIFDPRKEL
jgi:pilus assembly protein CpaF